VSVSRRLVIWGAAIMILLAAGLAVNSLAVAILTDRLAVAHHDLCQIQAQVHLVRQHLRMVVTGCGP
jgi:hypothetical protein